MITDPVLRDEHPDTEGFFALRAPCHMTVTIIS